MKIVLIIVGTGLYFLFAAVMGYVAWIVHKEDLEIHKHKGRWCVSEKKELGAQKDN